jgi:hypothetical protein
MVLNVLRFVDKCAPLNARLIVRTTTINTDARTFKQQNWELQSSSICSMAHSCYAHCYLYMQAFVEALGYLGAKHATWQEGWLTLLRYKVESEEAVVLPVSYN